MENPYCNTTADQFDFPEVDVECPNGSELDEECVDRCIAKYQADMQEAHEKACEQFDRASEERRRGITTALKAFEVCLVSSTSVEQCRQEAADLIDSNQRLFDAKVGALEGRFNLATSFAGREFKRCIERCCGFQPKREDEKQQDQ
jgi:hypothetical protein